MKRAVLAAVVLALVPAVVHALLPPTEFRELFERSTGFKMEITRDLSCMAAAFESQHKHGPAAKACGKFRLRWKPVLNIAGINVKGGDYIGGPHKWFGSDGLHMRVYEASYFDLFQDMSESAVATFAAAEHAPPIVAVSLRHQESESYFSEEMHEAMGLYGRHATVDRKKGGKPNPEAGLLAAALRGVRKVLGMEWFPQAQRMFSAVQAHYAATGQPAHYLLTGFSFGGTFATLLSAHSGYRVPVVAFAAPGSEDLLLESYPASSSANATNSALVWDATASRPNASVDAPNVFNFAHHWDATPQLDCQVGVVCGWVRRTRTSNATDADRDGKVDSEKLHAEERAVDRDGDGDVDPDDELPTEEESDARHRDMIWGLAEDDHNTPMFHDYLDANDMVPLCSGGGAYSHVFGSCTREAREWEERARAFHRWRRAYYRNDLMGRARKADGSAGGEADDDASHGLGGEDADVDGEEDGAEERDRHDGDGDDAKHDDDDDHTWSFAKRDDHDDDHDDL